MPVFYKVLNSEKYLSEHITDTLDIFHILIEYQNNISKEIWDYFYWFHLALVGNIEDN